MCVFLPVVASAIISQTLTLFLINSFSDVLTLTNICKNVRKTRVFKKGERISCGHQHSYRHNTTPLYLIQTFIMAKEVGFCRLNLFTEVAATVRVIKGVTMKDHFYYF